MGRLVGRILGFLETALGDSNDKPTQAQAHPGKDVEQPYAATAYGQQPYMQSQPEYNVHRDQQQAPRKHSGVNEFSGKKARFVGLFQMLNREKRAGMALRVAMAWGASVIVIGILFTILCATGTFPATVAEMKYVGIYVEYQVKYALYIVAGIATMAGVIMVYKAVRNSKSPWWGLFVLWSAVFVTLGTVGITIYLITKDAQLNVEWWSYLIQALVLIQRIALFLSIVAAIVAVHEALRDDWARQEMIEGRY